MKSPLAVVSRTGGGERDRAQADTSIEMVASSDGLTLARIHTLSLADDDDEASSSSQSDHEPHATTHNSLMIDSKSSRTVKQEKEPRKSTGPGVDDEGNEDFISQIWSNPNRLAFVKSSHHVSNPQKENNNNNLSNIQDDTTGLCFEGPSCESTAALTTTAVDPTLLSLASLGYATCSSLDPWTEWASSTLHDKDDGGHGGGRRRGGDGRSSRRSRRRSRHAATEDEPVGHEESALVAPPAISTSFSHDMAGRSLLIPLATTTAVTAAAASTSGGWMAPMDEMSEITNEFDRKSVHSSSRQQRFLPQYIHVPSNNNNNKAEEPLQGPSSSSHYAIPSSSTLSSNNNHNKVPTLPHDHSSLSSSKPLSEKSRRLPQRSPRVLWHPVVVDGSTTQQDEENKRFPF